MTPEGHPLLTPTSAERFWGRVDVGLCWEWTGARTAAGYGAVGLLNRVMLTHRVAWLTLVGPIHDGLELDHLCRNRACCNPDHLEPVTHAENVRRGGMAKAISASNLRRTANQTHCKRGHEFAGDNLYTRTNGTRGCRACDRIREANRPPRDRRRRDNDMASRGEGI